MGRTALPKCRYCGHPWRPPVGVVANRAYCPRCSDGRREYAREAHGLRPLTQEDFDGDCLLPAAQRPRCPSCLGSGWTERDGGMDRCTDCGGERT